MNAQNPGFLSYHAHSHGTSHHPNAWTYCCPHHCDDLSVISTENSQLTGVTGNTYLSMPHVSFHRFGTTRFHPDTESGHLYPVIFSHQFDVSSAEESKFFVSE